MIYPLCIYVYSTLYVYIYIHLHNTHIKCLHFEKIRLHINHRLSHYEVSGLESAADGSPGPCHPRPGTVLAWLHWLLRFNLWFLWLKSGGHLRPMEDDEEEEDDEDDDWWWWLMVIVDDSDDCDDDLILDQEMKGIVIYRYSTTICQDHFGLWMSTCHVLGEVPVFLGGSTSSINSNTTNGPRKYCMIPHFTDPILYIYICMYVCMYVCM